MMRAASYFLAVLTLLLSLGAPAARAQDEASSEAAAPPRPLCERFFGSLSSAEQKEYRQRCIAEKVPQPATPAAICSVAGIENKDLAAQVEQACVENVVSAYKTDVALRARNVALYEWQSDASDNMRILVWVVVLSGIAMAIYQLVIVMQIEMWRARRASRRGAAPEAEPAAAPAHQLELGLGKVQVTSSIAGIVVLVISIAFLYLYLTEVYAMKPIG